MNNSQSPLNVIQLDDKKSSPATDLPDTTLKLLPFLSSFKIISKRPTFGSFERILPLLTDFSMLYILQLACIAAVWVDWRINDMGKYANLGDNGAGKVTSALSDLALYGEHSGICCGEI